MHHSRKRQPYHNQKVLVNLKKEVLQVSVHAGLGVDGVLFIGKQVVELHYSHRDGFQLLCMEEGIS